VRRVCLDVTGCILLMAMATLAAYGSPFANAASVLELGMGARALGLGEAFVAIADDESALFYNPAGLAWHKGFSLLSSFETRLLEAGCGHISAVRGNLGIGVHYFDFGAVPETDEFGNAIGTFSYRTFALLAGAGLSAADLPLFSSMPMAESAALGLGVKLLSVDTLGPGDGTGFAIDLPFLLRFDSPPFGRDLINQFAFGILLQNVLGTPISYESGHAENWVKKVVLGTSVEIAEQLVIALRIASDNTASLGIEWAPISGISARIGLKRDRVWIWSLGTGVRYGKLAFDMALNAHPHLQDQIRGSLGIHW